MRQVTMVSLCVRLAAVSVLLLQPTAWALSGRQIISDLRALLSGGCEIVLASDATDPTSNFTPRYDLAAPPTYSVAVRPVLAADVQKVVKYALLKDVPILATGGGHGYSTSLGRVEGAIDIDLSAFNTVQVDVASRTMTIGGSVRADQVARALQAVGMEITVGQCSCVGFPGATLGGGIGPYAGLHGPISDSLVSVEMVTGRGDLLDVSSTRYPDLFYAMKGAGFNYGVATRLKYKIYPATNNGQAMIAQMVFPGALNGSVWSLFASFAASQPKELSISLAVGYSSESNGVSLVANFIYAGAESAGMAVIRPFLDLSPLNLNITTMAWADIPFAAFYGNIAKGGCTPGARYIPHALNLYQIDVPNLVNVVNHLSLAYAANETLRGVSLAWAQYARYGFQLQPDDSSAFPYRDVVAYVQVDGVYTDTSQVRAITEYGRDVRDMLQRGSGRDKLAVYVHFAYGDESPATMYSLAKLDVLVALKRAYDPRRLFSWYNPV